MKKTRIQALTKNALFRKLSVTELVEYMDEITDPEFCIEICLEIHHENKQDFDFLLEYCYRRSRQSGTGTVSSSLTEKLERQKRRLVTFCLLSNYQEFSFDEWIIFCSASIPQVISRMFNDGLHEDAFLLWRRHCGGKCFM